MSGDRERSANGAEGAGAPAVARRRFHRRLAAIEAQTLGGLDIVVEQLDRVLAALEHQDIALAELVVADDDRVDGRYLEVHQEILSLLALESPVAGDLRLVAALLHVIKHVERMGDQCVNVAKLIPLSGHEPPRRAEIVEHLLEMGRIARSEVRQAGRAFAERDATLAMSLAERDRRVNRLNREIFQRALECGTDYDVREWAMHMVLAARAFERIGDNAVDIGEQAVFLVTGLFRELPAAGGPERHAV